MTQTQQILAHLKDGKTITPLEALNLYGCLRLAAVIFDIKKLGYDIHTKTVAVGQHKHVAEYSLHIA
jgi:Helix-turn-helix domain